MGEPTWTFGRFDPPLMTMDFTLTEALTLKYKVIQKIKAFGQVLKEVRRRTPAGTYTYTQTTLPDIPPGEYPIQFIVTVKKKGVVVGKDIVTRYVTVVE